MPRVRPHSLSLLLSRDLASNIATPIFLVDVNGDLIFYNEAAEAVLGRTFSETGLLTRDEWGSMFSPVDEDGKPVAVDDLPLALALTHGRPAHAPLRITGSDGVIRWIEVTAVPLYATQDEVVGAIAIFWEHHGIGN
ncbi:MAG: PAS domain-containing protein [Actinomycetota bacterium]